MTRSSLTCLCVLLGVSLSLATTVPPRRVLEQDVSPDSIGVSSGWSRSRRVVASDLVPLYAAVSPVTPLSMDELSAVVDEVSDPASPAYGRHLNRDAVLAMSPPQSADGIVQWFLEGGAVSAELGGHDNIVKAVVPGPAAEALLNTTLYLFRHAVRTHLTLVRATAPYSVPSHLPISFIDGVLRLPQVPMSLHEASPSVDAASCMATDCTTECCQRVTPGVLASRYGLPSSVDGASQTSMAVAEFQGQKWDQTDLTKFASKCGLPNLTVNQSIPAAAEGSICAVPIIGQGACQESMLDIEYILGVTDGAIALTDVYSAGYTLLGWAWTVGNMSDADIPHVHSVSYGNDEQQQKSKAYIFSVAQEFGKLAARGVSIFIASGDQGPCGREGCSPSGYHPDFPGDCPFVTTVGGTNFATANTIGEETVWSDSGSGFSNDFATPSWQAKAVASYLSDTTGLPPQAKWNASGRAYPDIAALGGGTNPYCTAVGSLFGLSVYGTSAATPVVAGIFARLNAVRAARGAAPLGFLNPFIYSNGATAFHDVTTGVSTGGGKDGFPARTGFDAASGWGTPNYEKLVTLI